MNDLHPDPDLILDGTINNPTYFSFAGKTKQQQSVKPLPELLNNRYRLERLLGIGGMSAVYCAHDSIRAGFGTPSPHIAIKVMNDAFAEYPDANALLYSEFSLTQQLRHPGVVRLHDFDIDRQSQRAFITMEWLQGKPLDQLISENAQGLPWYQLQPIAIAILEALAYVHRQAVIHGDLKPSNIILSEEGVRLFDFGLGQASSGPLQKLPRLQRERFAAWTARYAALELLDGGPLSERCDIYAIACVLYELAAGQHPYQQQSARQAYEQSLHATIARPINFPGDCWHVLHGALSLDSSSRHITAEELLSTIQNTTKKRWQRWILSWRALPSRG